MMSACGSISLSHAIGYYSSDEYFTREGEESNYWFGKLKKHNQLPDLVTATDFKYIANENEITRKLHFRFMVPKELTKRFVDDDIKKKVVDLTKEAITYALNYAYDKYHLYGLSFPSNKLIQKDKKSSLFIFHSTSNYVHKSKSSFFDKVINDNSILEKYNQKLYELCLKNSLDIDPEHFNKANGVIKYQTGRVATDITFSAPKSMSIAMFADNRKLFDDFLNMHHEAVNNVLNYIEQNLVDHKSQNKLLTSSKGLLAAVCDHHTSRNLDPQVHSHCMIFHNIQGNNDKKARLENHRILQKIKPLGLMYRKELAKLLLEKGVGITFTDPQRYFYELKGIRSDWVSLFSSRSNEIKAAMKEEGYPLTDSMIRQSIAYKSRKAKKAIDFSKLENKWQNIYKEHGIVNLDLFNASNLMPIDFTDFDRLKKVRLYLDEMVKELTESKMAFTRDELFWVSSKKDHHLLITLYDIDGYIWENINKGLLLKGLIEGEELFYTLESKLLEESIYRDLKNGMGKSVGIDIQKIDNYLKDSDKRIGFNLTNDQVRALKLLESNDQFLVIQGSGGTGKTTILREINHIFTDNGYDMIGLSYMGVSAENIYEQANIKSSTIHSFFNHLEKLAGNYKKSDNLKLKKEWNFNGLKPSNKEVWIVDESSMLSNKMWAKLIEAAKLCNAKVLFTGDFKQLPGIGPGAIFTKLVSDKILNMVAMKKHVRQSEIPMAMKKSILFCEKSFDKTIKDPIRGDVNLIRESIRSIIDNIQYHENDLQRLMTISQEYVSLDQVVRNKSIIITSQNADRIQLNDLVREYLIEKGDLSTGRTYNLKDKDDNIIKREISVGDKVIFLANSRLYGKSIKNGHFGFVESISKKSLMVNTHLGLIRVKISDYPYIDHGYASTIHKAQSRTIPGIVFMNLDVNQKRSNNQNAFYVALTRSKKDIRIYTNGSVTEMESILSMKQYKPSILDFSKETPPFEEKELERPMNFNIN